MTATRPNPGQPCPLKAPIVHAPCRRSRIYVKSVTRFIKESLRKLLTAEPFGGGRRKRLHRRNGVNGDERRERPFDWPARKARRQPRCKSHQYKPRNPPSAACIGGSYVAAGRLR